MPTDVEIAHQVSPRPIAEVAGDLGLGADDLLPYGRDKAKVQLSVLERTRKRDNPPRLILVSAITPTPAGEGKTTTTIGLGQALSRLGHSTCLALREPSLGPCMGIKGGATGGGKSQVIPMESINLHFTGDFHAVTAAHNLLAALLDNHIHFGSGVSIHPQRVLWRRVIDMNDRALRNVIIGLGGVMQGVPRETGFDITAASEVMAMLCLSSSLDDLRVRLDRTLVAFGSDGQPVLAKELGATGAMLALLRDALMPNLVQTLEGTPALIHGGPFANIAHGCNSVLATRMALHLSDWAITEAGFGFDLGAEKFFDIKCVSAGLDTAAVVLVATIRALKMHGGRKLSDLAEVDPGAVRSGLPNLTKHIENIRCFGEVPVVALNRFGADTDAEIEIVRAHCQSLGVPFAVSDHHARGGEGALELARTVVAHAEKTPRPFRPLYDWKLPVVDKIRTVAQKMYGARDVRLTKDALKDLADVERLGYAELPVCIAKTQSSLSDDPKLRGRPKDFEVTVRRIQINAGAGFLVVLTGDILRMPGLPRKPSAEGIDVVDGEIVGLS
ncbi:MAG: formate--tetrahydrofolate ligase [Myxococcales bacterium]|nr:formate--tetrahydrofolate ligase [Myxococcales bacterium]MCB9578891.1 formate--tetrahydrofolate ligase [Polyangiaceae bacterium]